MNADARLAAGQMFGRYQIVRVLGQGGMAVVYEAIHPGLKKRFAIKTLLPAMAEQSSVRARFLREGEATARIVHPHVVDVVDVGEADGMPFLVMALLEGETLADLIAARGALAVGEAVDLLLPVLSAVAAGHAQGVVHRDLKPSNIFLARGPWGDRVPKVLDFGISKLIGDTQGGPLTGTLTVLGTAAYMSPEQTRGARELDGRSDQYSLGLILYEMLTGQRAHDGSHAVEVLHNIANGVFKPPRQVRRDLPPALDNVVLQMMALEGAARFPSLLAAGRALLPFATERARVTFGEAFSREPPAADARKDAASGPPTTRAPRPGDPIVSTTFREAAAELSLDGSPATRGRRGRLMAVVAVGAALAGGAAGWVFINRRPQSVVGPPPNAAAAVPAVSAPAAAPEVPPAIEPREGAPRPSDPPVVRSPPVDVGAGRTAPAPSAATTPTRRVHHRRAGHAAAAPAAPVARDAAESPKRGANNALIIK